MKPLKGKPMEAVSRTAYVLAHSCERLISSLVLKQTWNSSRNNEGCTMFAGDSECVGLVGKSY